jgi:uncharacterized protein (TIGR03437 family)
VVLGAADLDGIRLTAQYQLLGRLTLTSEPSGLAMRVDGRECNTPCLIDRAEGIEIRFSAPKHVTLHEGSRLTLSDWIDAGDAEQTFHFSSAATAYHAGYRLMHRLNAVADRPNAAVLGAEPDSRDGFYEDSSEVQVTVQPLAGHRFRGWEGDASGAYRTVSVRMTAPRFVRAVLEPVPFVPPAGARNAAGATPTNAVAPGSLVSLFGVNLTAVTEIGPVSPLAQTLGGAVVRLGTRMLPLIFVSPEQINLQLPHDIEPGAHRLVLQSEGQGETGIDIVVQRNAPGLFHELVGDQPLAIATRFDGSRVTPEAPAKRGEDVIILGTGLGPYDRTPVAGFAIPAGGVYRLADAVEVLSSDGVWEVQFAGAAERLTGIDVLRFRVPPEAPSGIVSLKVASNGTESNTVTLPVE